MTREPMDTQLKNIRLNIMRMHGPLKEDGMGSQHLERCLKNHTIAKVGAPLVMNDHL